MRREQRVLSVTTRRITHTYTDPLDLVWIEAARRLGMRVERTPEVYASWDGQGTLSLATPEALDPDDSLAQLIFHEICHALVAGSDGRRQPDWALDNTSTKDLVFEHACHRVQAALTHPYGLRDFFAVTTEWRPYWDALPPDPLAPSDDPAVPLARRAFRASEEPPFADVLREALEATARIAEVVRPFAPASSLWHLTRPRHPSGFLRHEDETLRCGDCAWAKRTPHGLTCRQAARARIVNAPKLDDALVACERWEPPLDEASCASCGACCREGFDRVELRRRDTLHKKRPDLVSVDRWGTFVPRPDGRCVALQGDGATAPYRCQVYEDRPRACALFEIGGDACLIARRRVGLSR